MDEGERGGEGRCRRVKRGQGGRKRRASSVFLNRNQLFNPFSSDKYACIKVMKQGRGKVNREEKTNE